MLHQCSFFLAGAEEPAGNVLEDLKDLRLEVLQSNNCRGTSVVLEVPAHLKDLSRTRGTCPSQGSADASTGSPSSAEPWCPSTWEAAEGHHRGPRRAWNRIR